MGTLPARSARAPRPAYSLETADLDAHDVGGVVGGDLGGELLVVAVPGGEVAFDVDGRVLLLELLDDLFGELLPGVAAPVGEAEIEPCRCPPGRRRCRRHRRRPCVITAADEQGDRPRGRARAETSRLYLLVKSCGGCEELFQAGGRQASDQVLLAGQEEPEDRAAATRSTSRTSGPTRTRRWSPGRRAARPATV